MKRINLTICMTVLLMMVGIAIYDSPIAFAGNDDFGGSNTSGSSSSSGNSSTSSGQSWNNTDLPNVQGNETMGVDESTGYGKGTDGIGNGNNQHGTAAGATHNYSTQGGMGFVYIPANEFGSDGKLTLGNNYYGKTTVNLQPGASGALVLMFFGRNDHEGKAVASFSHNGDNIWNNRERGGLVSWNDADADFSKAEVEAIYNAAVAAGLLPAGISFQDWLESGMSYFSITDDIINPCTENCDEDPEDPDDPTPPPVLPPPTPSCHRGNDWGDTEGSVSVMNMTTSTGWLKEGTIYARPGDTIRFSTYYCWGAQAVQGSADSPNSPWATDQRNLKSWFRLEAQRSPAYLFGEDARFIGTATHVLTAPHNSTIGATGSGVDNGHVEWSRDWSFLMYSPSNKGSDSTRYNCQVFDFSPFFINYGFQIPGIATGGCPAASNTGNLSDVGETISQTIHYNRVQAWKLWSHQESGHCDTSCNYEDGDLDGYIQYYPDTDSRHDFGRRNERVRSNPYSTLAEAKSMDIAGLVRSHESDTLWHGTPYDGHNECNSSRCGCNAWEHWVIDGCYNCESYSEPDENGHSHCTDDDPWDDCWLGCGRSEAERCTNRPGIKYSYPNNYDWSTDNGAVHPVDLGETSSTATVLVPYNYMTTAESYLQASEVIYTGQSVSSTFTVDIKPRINTSVRPSEAYATLLDGEIRAVEFIVSADSSPNVEGSSNAGGQDPCAYYGSRMNIISECNSIWTESGGLNPEGRYLGKHYTGSATQVIPDAEKYPTGSKYCVAVGISHSDSHGVPDAYTVSGMSSPSGWRISGASCRTIAKKPNFQVWNGGLYTNGSITTSIARKDVGSELGESYNPDAIFGSWDEYYVIARKGIYNFASGAGFGYYGKEKNTSLGLMGGSSPNATNCQITRMTISNEDCGDAMTGNSQVTNSVDSLLSRIYSRYTDATLPNGMNTLANGARYYKQTSGFSTSAIGNPIRQDKSTVDTESQQTTSNYASNLLVIHSTGKITVDTNICDGAGSCNDSTNVLRLGARNTDVYNSIYSLPQVIIIAEGGIDITANVTQIDAWLITPTGRVNTCTSFHLGSSDMNSCPNTLIINGPIIAKSMSLGRTGGAFNGAGNFGTSNVLDKNLADSGSITPAEIMNLRPDVLYWAYGQAQRYSQAAVTYTRELAPRY